ncbi:HAD-IA family hydrolase [Cyanobium sp. Cruz CV13-4-11]|jgi:pseudouridine 5'-phosphatase|uniref:HAD family hydrolase n=1 Tax=unclassified Cyanobium TaxID=2627006 RepID=UPI0020CEAF59|nr:MULTISPECIES: HAD-IA family hydrolase [unclassified Cyanobium]MCP9899204.1 HAD-IA family hydrolase [Cyanobium sp. Cruz CV11-17]MCP9918051.1 HAD-IA family hydrolase [Cyanobium sp. Cruz CV13-4-11]
MPQRPAACLFDLDGLLLDTEPAHARAWQEASTRFGRPLAGAELLSLRGRRRLDCASQVQQWIIAAGGAPLSVQELLAVRQPIAEALLATAPAMPGAEVLVRRCVALGIPMALATSSAQQAVAVKVAPHPWLTLIRERVHGDDPDLGGGKPAPDPFLLAARRLGVAPTACWAFEDSSAGVAAALGAGCRVHVLLPPGVGCQAYPEGVICLNSLEEVELD